MTKCQTTYSCPGYLLLGATLWDTICLIRDQAALIPVVDLKYCNEDPFAADIVLRLRSNGIELWFEPHTQRLRLIVVDDFQKVRLTYHDHEVSSPKSIPTAKHITNIIGPFAPGQPSNNYTIDQYTISYPGITAVFPLPEHVREQIRMSSKMGHELLEVPIELPGGGTPFASHLYLYQGENWLKTPTPLPTRSPPHSRRPGDHIRGELERVIAQINYGVDMYFAVYNTLPGVKNPTPQHRHKYSILLHTTSSQDLMADLGAPGSIYYKEEDKLQIHAAYNESQDDDGIMGTMDDIGYDRSSRPAQGSQHPKDYFYNYFHFGIDVLFDGSSHRCKKIVMHSNLPGHFDFQSYKRCPYILQQASESSIRTIDGSRSPLLGAQVPIQQQSQFVDLQENLAETTSKAGKKRNKNSAAQSEAAAMDSGHLFASNVESVQGSPETAQQQQSGGLIPVSLEKGITPDTKTPMIISLLDLSPPDVFSDGNPENVTMNIKNIGLNYYRGTGSQDPYNPTKLFGTDGVVFEATDTGYVATVTLY
ncbi:hypothetical protein BGX31_003076 [Mortierella sp. GBA43]|nr:hypothetical protein BGX31_003076 [Mortierella sp. GBA43]